MESLLIWFFAGLVGIVALVRFYLLAFPYTNVNLGNYNVHHLYTGALLLIVASIFMVSGFAGKWLALFSGVASGLIVDQLVYLVTSRGGHKAYFGKVSFWGMAGVTFLLICIGILAYSIQYFF